MMDPVMTKLPMDPGIHPSANPPLTAGIKEVMDEAEAQDL